MIPLRDDCGASGSIDNNSSKFPSGSGKYSDAAGIHAGYWFVGRLSLEVERNSMSSAQARGCVEQILKIHSKCEVKAQPLRTCANFP
jgi:hypothetical protein